MVSIGVDPATNEGLPGGCIPTRTIAFTKQALQELQLPHDIVATLFLEDGLTAARFGLTLHLGHVTIRAPKLVGCLSNELGGTWVQPFAFRW